MRSLEQAICECTRKAEANRELAKYNKSHVDRANDLKNAEECEQLAAWLRELQERRKAPEIITCGECKHRDPEDKKCDCGHDIIWQLPRGDDWYCADAERRTDD